MAAKPYPNAVLLYAEDDLTLAEITIEHLEAQGYQVLHAKNGREALQVLSQRNVDLVLLDVMMPGQDGLAVAETIRQEDTLTPILFVTAKSQKEDRIAGLKLGADDYITKPFSMEELLLKIQVFLRRSGHVQQQTARKVTFGRCVFDMEKRVLECADEVHTLTHKEASILRLLCLNAGQVVKRDEILISVWGDNTYFNGRSLDVFMSKLRKLLKGDTETEIISVHGVGYRLVTSTAVELA